MKNIKRCPFCFSDDLDIVVTPVTDQELKDLYKSVNSYFVFCNCCSSCGPQDYKKNKAIKEWDTRPCENYLIDCIRGLK